MCASKTKFWGQWRDEDDIKSFIYGIIFKADNIFHVLIRGPCVSKILEPVIFNQTSCPLMWAPLVPRLLQLSHHAGCHPRAGNVLALSLSGVRDVVVANFLSCCGVMSWGGYLGCINELSECFHSWRGCECRLGTRARGKNCLIVIASCYRFTYGCGDGECT